MVFSCLDILRLPSLFTTWSGSEEERCFLCLFCFLFCVFLIFFYENFWVLGLSQSCTVLVFSGSVLTPVSEAMWSKNWPLIWKKHIWKVSILILQIRIGQGYVSVVVYFPQRWPLGPLCHPYIIYTPPSVVLWVYSVKVFKMYLTNQRGWNEPQ